MPAFALTSEVFNLEKDKVFKSPCKMVYQTTSRNDYKPYSIRGTVLYRENRGLVDPRAEKGEPFVGSSAYRSTFQNYQNAGPPRENHP